MYCSYFFLIFLIVWMCSFIYLVFKPQSIPLVWISSVFDWLSFLFSKFQFDFLVFYLFVEFMFYILYWLSYFGWMVTCVVFEFIREFVHFFLLFLDIFKTCFWNSFVFGFYFIFIEICYYNGIFRGIAVPWFFSMFLIFLYWNLACTELDGFL